jgi:multisubunit Na+/H+ antiporter MnhC subunit
VTKLRLICLGGDRFYQGFKVGSITPSSVLPKILVMVEIVIGLFLTVFVLGSFVGLQNAPDDKRGE